ncbi:hypothetical protein [Pleionea litopenaei]|uniref:Chemotaxis protein n=1 Tax=Pleionea litopenaei TaxID=3070815 RepID=A0AA51RTB7_9GAMM|nr:hypothetical protein [Pleionea sp. HL-JVS1]WMS87094.1 hypothetical protein Q9312_17950 [Pleionea sp. HL-JVS1]
MAESARQFISIAKIASELYHAKSIAIELSITSKNARALAARAGTSAAGFNEITGFIESLAILTIATANQVNKRAVALVHDSARLFRDNGLLSQLQKSYQQADDSVKNKIRPLLEQTRGKIALNEQTTFSDITLLAKQIAQTQNDLRSAKIVTVVARIESTRADPSLQDSLQSVADNVERSSQAIAKHLRQAQTHLDKE